MERSRRRPGADGFTLIEVLVSIVVLALVGVAVAAISITGVIQIGDGASERQQDATSAQWVSLVFARDVQGAAAVVDECAPTSGTTHLVTVQASDSTRKVEYRTRATAEGNELIRVICDPGGSSRMVVDGLATVPQVRCEAEDGTVGPCVPATAPRRINLDVSRTASFGFALDAARRMTDGNSAGPPLEVPAFMSLGGDTPLRAGGNGRLEVVGSALINRPSTTDVAVDLFGNAELEVSGDFELQAGAVCDGCAGRANKTPGTYQTRLLDPLRFLPEPDTAPLAARSSCPVQSGIRVCLPGIYAAEFPPSGGGAGGVKDYRLEPGVYVLRDGIKLNNGSLNGAEVLIYNELGNVKITGADLDLQPSSSGIYSGILFFQARSNTAQFEIVGNTSLGTACPSLGATLSGTIYAPASVNVLLGGGNGRMCVGRVIGQNLELSGGGTVIVDGS